MDFSLISCQRRGFWCNIGIRNPFSQSISTMVHVYTFQKLSIKLTKELWSNISYWPWIGYKIWDIFFSVIILVSVESLLQERELCCYMTILTLYFFFFPQDYDKMLMDLSDLQRADRERRLNIVANIPVSFICRLCYLITYFRLVHWNLSYFLKYCQKIDPIIIMNYQFFLN